MKPIFISPDPGSIPVEAEQIMQLPDMAGREGDPYTLALIGELIAKCRELCSPQAAFLPLELPVRGFTMGRILDKMLRGSEYYVFFIATAGPGPEQLARHLMNAGSYLEGFLVDLIATQLAEGVAIKVHEAIGKYAATLGKKTTNRYSPGYCSWDVAEQHLLFSLFDGHTCGVKLSESALMIPVKSVSGVVGMGREVIFNEYTCEICNQKNCIYRKIRVARH